jgi:hypothetical protein
MTVLGLVDEETHREVFQTIADKFKDGMVFVETGVFLGSDIITFALRCKHRKVYPDIWAIDNFLSENISEASKTYVGVHDHFREAFERNLQINGVDDLVSIVQEDSVEAADTFIDESIDFLFLDSCHEYTFVKCELERWLPKMKKNSILSGHDYPSDGIRRAVAEVLGEVTTTSNGASYIKVLGEGL